MTRDELVNQESGRICICKDNMQEMENFLSRNSIPYSVESGEQGVTVFWVRAGFDYRDAQIFALKKWGDLRNPKVVNHINNLVLERDYPEPRFEYEQYGGRHVDCWLLNAFVG